MILVFDENFGEQVAAAMQAALKNEVVCVHTRSWVGVGASDEQILARMAEYPDAILVTVDQRIKRSPHEKAALLAAGCSVLVGLKQWNQSENRERIGRLLILWPEIKRALDTYSRGSWFELPWSKSPQPLIPVGKTRAERKRLRAGRRARKPTGGSD